MVTLAGDGTVLGALVRVRQHHCECDAIFPASRRIAAIAAMGSVALLLLSGGPQALAVGLAGRRFERQGIYRPRFARHGTPRSRRHHTNV